MVVRGEDRREAGGPSRSGEGSPSIPQQDGPAKEHRRGVTTTFEVPIELAGTAILDSRGHLLDAECRVLQQPLGNGRSKPIEIRRESTSRVLVQEATDVPDGQRRVARDVTETRFTIAHLDDLQHAIQALMTAHAATDRLIAAFDEAEAFELKGTKESHDSLQVPGGPASGIAFQELPNPIEAAWAIGWSPACRPRPIAQALPSS